MDHIQTTVKRLVLYVFGLFFMAIGVNFSILAAFGVSPVSSLAYAFTLSVGLSIGVTTVISNILFIFVQIILNKMVDIRDFLLQLVIAFLFGFFMDAAYFLGGFLPEASSIISRIIYLIISLFVVAIGLLGYTFAKFPLMPYDALTYVISERFKLKFSKAKVISDVINVCVAGVVCLVFIQTLGAVGIGTIVAALLIGRILGWMMKYLEGPLRKWAFENEPKQPKKSTNKKKEDSNVI